MFLLGGTTLLLSSALLSQPNDGSLKGYTDIALDIEPQTHGHVTPAQHRTSRYLNLTPGFPTPWHTILLTTQVRKLDTRIVANQVGPLVRGAQTETRVCLADLGLLCVAWFRH
jgi:hypothetical protein